MGFQRSAEGLGQSTQSLIESRSCVASCGLYESAGHQPWTMKVNWRWGCVIIFYQPFYRTHHGKRAIGRFHDVSKIESKMVWEESRGKVANSNSTLLTKLPMSSWLNHLESHSSKEWQATKTGSSKRLLFRTHFASGELSKLNFPMIMEIIPKVLEPNKTDGLKSKRSPSRRLLICDWNMIKNVKY